MWRLSSIYLFCLSSEGLRASTVEWATVPGDTEVATTSSEVVPALSPGPNLLEPFRSAEEAFATSHANLKEITTEELSTVKRDLETATRTFKDVEGAKNSAEVAFDSARRDFKIKREAMCDYYESQSYPEPKVIVEKKYKDTDIAQGVYYVKADEMETIFRKQNFQKTITGPQRTRSVSLRLLNDGLEKVSDDKWYTFNKVDDDKLGRVLHRVVEIQGVPKDSGGDKINGLWFRIERRQNKSAWQG